MDKAQAIQELFVYVIHVVVMFVAVLIVAKVIGDIRKARGNQHELEVPVPDPEEEYLKPIRRTATNAWTCFWDAVLMILLVALCVTMGLLSPNMVVMNLWFVAALLSMTLLLYCFWIYHEVQPAHKALLKEGGGLTRTHLDQGPQIVLKPVETAEDVAQEREKVVGEVEASTLPLPVVESGEQEGQEEHDDADGHTHAHGPTPGPNATFDYIGWWRLSFTVFDKRGNPRFRENDPSFGAEIKQLFEGGISAVSNKLPASTLVGEQTTFSLIVEASLRVAILPHEEVSGGQHPRDYYIDRKWVDENGGLKPQFIILFYKRNAKKISKDLEGLKGEELARVERLYGIEVLGIVINQILFSEDVQKLQEADLKAKAVEDIAKRYAKLPSRAVEQAQVSLGHRRGSTITIGSPTDGGGSGGGVSSVDRVIGAAEHFLSEVRETRGSGNNDSGSKKGQ